MAQLYVDVIYRMQQHIKLGDIIKCMSIVTKTGDKGETGLFGGQRVPKDDVRIETIGTVDELNAVLGMVIASLRATSPFPQPLPPRGAGERHEEDYRCNHQINGSVLEHAREMRKSPTNAEKYLWHHLRSDQLGIRFRKQHPIGGYILDFYCPKAKLGIEVDGPIHDDPMRQEADDRRTDKLSDEGIFILRFKNEEVLYDTKTVLNTIRMHIHPPPLAGEGLGEGEAVDEKEKLGIGEDLIRMLTKIQNTLFTLGADLATPHENNKAVVPRIEKEHIEEIEGWIATLEETPLPPYFILPGGSKSAAELHLARAMCRRAERCTVTLSRRTEIGSNVVQYLNRLSDFLFLASLEANRLANVENIRVSYF